MHLQYQIVTVHSKQSIQKQGGRKNDNNKK